MGCDALDPLSYTAPARIKVLLSPIRPIKKARFQELCKAISDVNVVRLDEIPVQSGKEYNHFDPRSLPSSRIIYDFTTELDKDHAYLETFESWRRTFAVILIGDGEESLTPDDVEKAVRSISDTTTSAILFSSFLFDTAHSTEVSWPPNTHPLSSESSMSSSRATVRDVLTDFSSALLLKLNMLYTQIRDLSLINSPYDPASDFIRAGPKRVTSFALHDAHTPISRSVSPAADRGPRFTSGSQPIPNSEKGKIQGQAQGRTTKICGDLLLVSGFCSSALKHYAEAAAISRANNDFLWQATALEGIGVCLVLTTYYEVQVQVPLIALSSSTISSLTKSGDVKAVVVQRGDIDLIDFLPELHTSIMTLFTKSATTDNDQVPPFVLAESTLRMAKFLATIHIAGGLNRSALGLMVLGNPSNLSRAATVSYPPRAEIAAWAMRAYSGPTESLSLPDKLHIYAGIATVLGAINFKRRRGLFLRQIVLTLIPALVQARVAGAAGMGIHPSASLALSESQNTNFSREVLLRAKHSASSVASLLKALTETFGIPDYREEKALQGVTLSGYGWPFLQETILKDCIGICEAIPNFDGVLHYSLCSLLTRLDVLERDEQVRLASNIPRIVSAAKRSGLLDIQLDYWDRYAIRGITIKANSNTPSKVLRTVGQKLGDTTEVASSRFLYNPYAKGASRTELPTVVRDEPAELEITLQNPFEFDVEIMELCPVFDSADIIVQNVSRIILKSLSTHNIQAEFTARQSGKVSITGCSLIMANCRKTILSIRSQPQRSDIDRWFLNRGGIARVKDTGLDARLPKLRKSEDNKSILGDFGTVELEVLPPAPTLSLAPACLTLLENIALLEGEYSFVVLSLHNDSSLLVNHIDFSFSDSTTRPLEQALESRTKQPFEIYELETFLRRRWAMDYVPTVKAHNIGVKSTNDYRVELRGKRGFATGEIKIDYGHFATSTDDAEQFYTRRLTVPITVLVSPSVSIVHCDILPLAQVERFKDATKQAELDPQYSRFIDLRPSADDYCLLVLDLRNFYEQDMVISLSLDNSSSTKTESESILDVSDSITAGSSRRFLLPLKKWFLSQYELNQAIPSLTNRQFTVSTATADVDVNNNQIFWAREALLTRLSVTWSTGGRTGTVEERSIAINRRMLKTMLLETCQLRLVKPDSLHLDEPFDITMYINSMHESTICVFIRVDVTLFPDEDIDGNHCLILQGVGQLPMTIAPGMNERHLPFIATSTGQYKVVVSMQLVRDDGSLENLQMSSIVLEVN